VRALGPDEVPPLPTRFKPFLGGTGKGGEGDEFEGTGSVDAPDPVAADVSAQKTAQKAATKKPSGR